MRAPEFRQEMETKSGWTKWLSPFHTKYKIACCDCGLVHDVQFRIKHDRVQVRFSRNRKGTTARRRALALAKEGAA